MTPKILIEKPPIYDNARAAFKINPDTVIFAYGDTIYNPADVKIPEDIIVHEMVHLEQHKHSRKEAALWWGKYLRDPEFRLSQEVEAYGAQYQWICRHKTQNPQIRFNVLKRFGEILSGPLYANCVGLQKAMRLIEEQSKTYASIH